MDLKSVHLFILCMVMLFSYQLYRCIDKYREYETIDKKSTVEDDSARFPMVSISPVPGYKQTKEGSFFDISAAINHYCFLTGDNINYTACLEDAVFKPQEMIEAVLYNDMPLRFEDVIVTPPTPLLIPLGRTFTFYHGSDITGEGQRFTFKVRNMEEFPVHPTLTFQFHVNGTYFPYVYLDAKNFDDRAEVRFTASSNNHVVVSVLLRRRHRINTPNNPCVEEEDYTNIKCVEEYVAKTIGCASPWTNVEVNIRLYFSTKNVRIYNFAFYVELFIGARCVLIKRI